jgi:hypothetical protein
LSTVILKNPSFYTGDIDSNPEPVPLPSGCVLLASGLPELGAGWRWKGPKSRNQTAYSICQKFFPFIPSPPSGGRATVYFVKLQVAAVGSSRYDF